jgi:hypothetical protein
MEEGNKRRIVRIKREYKEGIYVFLKDHPLASSKSRPNPAK